MAIKSFKNWILKQKEEDSLVGDLARDISCDPDFPSGDNYSQIREYLEEKSRHPGVMEAFNLAWKGYLASK